MNCYLRARKREGASRPALGLCRSCGAGVCACHLVQMTTSPAIGMGAATLPRRYLLCAQCYEDRVTPTSRSSLHRQQPDLARRFLPAWWRGRGQSRQSELPKPEEAVAWVEGLLKRQRQP